MMGKRRPMGKDMDNEPTSTDVKPPLGPHGELLLLLKDTRASVDNGGRGAVEMLSEAIARLERLVLTEQFRIQRRRRYIAEANAAELARLAPEGVDVPTAAQLDVFVADRELDTDSLLV